MSMIREVTERGCPGKSISSMEAGARKTSSSGKLEERAGDMKISKQLP